MRFCHKPSISVAMELIPTWFAKSLCLGDFFEKKVGNSEGKFCRKSRRNTLNAKTKKLKVVALENIGTVNYFYLTDGTFTYKLKIVEGKRYVFLMDFTEEGLDYYGLEIFR
jgi:hypothetical protein